MGNPFGFANANAGIQKSQWQNHCYLGHAKVVDACESKCRAKGERLTG